jgi:hypothetical protein
MQQHAKETSLQIDRSNFYFKNYPNPQKCNKYKEIKIWDSEKAQICNEDRKWNKILQFFSMMEKGRKKKFCTVKFGKKIETAFFLHRVVFFPINIEI